MTSGTADAYVHGAGRLFARLALLAWVVVLGAVVVGAAKFDDAWAVAVAMAATPTLVLAARDELADSAFRAPATNAWRIAAAAMPLARGAA